MMLVTLRLKGLKGAITGASGIVYGKAAIAGLESTSGAVSAGAGSIDTVFGYPVATSGAITAIVDGIGDDFVFKSTGGESGPVYFGIKNYTKKMCSLYTSNG